MRFTILISAVLMQMCLGATYSWSVYVQPIKQYLHLQQGPAQIPFTVFYFIFPLTMMITGPCLHRIGPRFSAIIGGLLFGGGWLMASLGSHSFMFTILGIGVMSGVGAGMAYIVPIAVCIQWFPRNKGLVTGVAVAGFGGGAALVSQLGGMLMESLGKTPFQTFLIFGMCFLVIICSAGSAMQFPGEYHSSRHSEKIKFVKLARDPVFQVLYIAMFIGLAAGFAVNANLRELFHNGPGTVRTGVIAVSLFALANASGRILWGMFFDRVKSATAIQANLALQALVLLFSPVLLDSSSGFLLFALMTGLNFGGVLVIYVSTASRCWGPDKVSRIYSILFSSNIPASISPILAGVLFDNFASFDVAMYGLAAFLVIGIIYVKQQSNHINAY